MTTITKLPAVETSSLVMREIELRDTPSFANFMTQEAYQRHIAARLSSEQEVPTLFEALKGDQRDV